MSHLLTDITPVARHEIATTVREKIEEAARQRDTHTGIVRLTVRVEDSQPLKLLRWLAALETGRLADQPKFYWSDRDRLRETATVGAADSLTAYSSGELAALFDHLAAGLSDQPDTIRYFGGLRFDPWYEPTENQSVWTGFPVATFILPRFELVRYGESLLFACNITSQDWREASLKKILDRLEAVAFEESPQNLSQPGLIARTDRPDRTAWSSMMTSADSLLADGDLKKIVLARQSSLSFRRPLSPWRLLDQLTAGSDGCYLFGLSSGQGKAFIGSSPERLYKREGIRLQTEAVAGTRPRGDSPEDDARLSEELQASDKDAREHQFVITGITEVLDQLGVRYKLASHPSLISLSRVHHLACPITVKLTEQIGDRHLLEALHPTPAVGGYPGRAAVARIRQIEPFDRGWYAGPIGWLGRESAEFAVGLRSAVVEGSSLHLFAGAGIVPGSDPDSEWREIETKISRFLSIVAE